MKSQFYSILIAAGLLVGSCSPAKTSDPEDQTTTESPESIPATEESTTTDQRFISTQELQLQGITFKISATNKQPINSIVVSVEGLEIGDDTQTIEIAGGLVNAETEDMNSDGSPELILFLNSYGEEPEEFAVGFSVNNQKSMSRVAIPPLTSEQEVGYQGGGEMAIVETKLIRRFPVYEQIGEEWVKTDKTRQLQYALKEGEASRQFVLDKVIEF